MTATRLPRPSSASMAARRWLAGARRPGVYLAAVVIGVVAVLVVLPVGNLVGDLVWGEDRGVWAEITSARLGPNLLWTPLVNTLTLGLVVGGLSVVIGGGLAWLVTMTDVPGRRLFALLATIPFALPSFGLALAWESVFRNDLVGESRAGLLASTGVPVPDWLAWGRLPVALVLAAHYFPIVFLLVAAALSTVKGDLIEAGKMTGAGPWRIATGIAFPVVRPAVTAGFLLAFAEAVSNFAAPAILGLPVRFHTLSTRVFGMISTGQRERGFALAVVMIGIAVVVLALSTRASRRRGSFETISGKGARSAVIHLGQWRRPFAGAAATLLTATTIIPVIVLALTTFMRRTGTLSQGLTMHYWIGSPDPAISQGQPGILRNPQLIDAATTTISFGLLVGLGTILLALAIGYVVVKAKVGRIATVVSAFAYMPFFIPGIALGAAFIGLYGGSIGPLPALYGTITLLVMGGLAVNLPFASESGRSALAQVGTELEEAAALTGAAFLRRLARIVVPLTAKGLLAAGILAFVKMVRDLSVVVLLATPTTNVLTVQAFRYASEGFTQMANGVVVIIAIISIVFTIAARRLDGSQQQWSKA